LKAFLQKYWTTKFAIKATFRYLGVSPKAQHGTDLVKIEETRLSTSAENIL
jgi:hypothetical protein